MVTSHATRVALGIAAACAAGCSESHSADGGADRGTDGRCPADGYIDIAFRVPGSDDFTACGPLSAPLFVAGAGVIVTRSPEMGCSVSFGSAYAVFPDFATDVSAGGPWFEREGPIEGGFITNIFSSESVYCPDGATSRCGYTAYCAARVTRAGSMTGESIAAELTAPCALSRVESGLPEGLVVTSLRLSGPLVTFSTGDSGVACP